MEEFKFTENKIEKPQFLYHGSIDKNIEEFSPRPSEFMGEKKNLFFASPNRKASIAYMYEGDHDWSSGITHSTGEIDSIFPITREEFIKKDKGGAIYKFDPESFSSHQKRYKYEWVTDQKVKPIEKEVFESSLKAMEDAGIKLHFLGSKEKYMEYLSLKPGKERDDFLKNVQFS